MNVIRLVVMGILFYIAWRLVQAILGGVSKTGKLRKSKQNGFDSTVQDVLVEDPECHKLVPRNQAVKCRIDKKTYYFCSDTCCDNFSDKQRKEK